MLLAIRIVARLALVVVGTQGPAFAQSDDAKSLQQKFAAERAEAIKAQYPPESLARADEFARRAEAALKEDNANAAARYFRDARWQLPYLPAGLPPHVLRVLGESRMRHTDRVNALAYSPDGTRLASASRDGTVKVWDLGNGRELVTYRGHLDQPDDPTKNLTNVLGATDVAFHPKEKIVASSSGNQVHLWDPETGKPIKTILNIGKSDKPLKTLAYSPDGKFLAVGGDDGVLRVVESDTGKARYTSPSRNARIEHVAYSPNGNMIAVGDSNTQVGIYAPSQPNPLVMTMPGVDLGEVMGVAFAADNGFIFSCGRDGKARLTPGPKPDGTSAGNTAAKQREYSAPNGGIVTCLAATNDGNHLITGGDDRVVRIWDVASARLLRSFQGHMKRLTAVATRPDGKQVASASDDGAIRMWDLNTTDEHRALTDAADSLWAVAFSPDGNRVAAAGSDLAIRIYHPQTGKLEATLTGARSPITSLAFFPDSNRLVAAGGDRVVVLWDVEKQKILKELPGHESAIMSLAVSDDSNQILSGGAVGDRSVRAFAPTGGKPVWTWTGRSAVCAVAIRKGGKQAAAGLADGSLVTLNIGGPTPKEAYHAAHIAGVACVAYSRDGNRLATVGGDGIVRVWTVAENGAIAPLVRFEGQSRPGAPGSFTPLTGVAFAPDSRYVAAVGSDAVVRIWDIETKSEVRGFRGHVDWVAAVAFSPNGRYLASVGVEKDHALRIFEIPSFDAVASGGHLLAVNAVAVSPDGKTAATASIDQTIKLWDIATGKPIRTLIGNEDTPFSVAFLGNSALVMGGSLPSRDSGRLHFWQTDPPAESSPVQTGEVYTVVAAPDGARVGAWTARVAVGDVKNYAYEIYDARGKLLSTLSDKGRKILCATFSPDLGWAVAGDDHGTVRIWDLVKRDRIGDDFPIHVNEVIDLGITADKTILVAVDSKGLVKIASIADPKKREVLGSVVAHKAGVRSLVVSPTGTSFVTIGADREVKAWSLAAADRKDPKPMRSWNLPVHVNGAVFTPDGKQLITANADGTAYILEIPASNTN